MNGFLAMGKLLLARLHNLRARGVGWDTSGFMAEVYTLTRVGANQQITTDEQRLLGLAPQPG